MGTVIFDMDGVMFDTEKIFVKAYDYAGKKMGIKKAGYMAMKTLGMNIDVAKKIWLQEFGEKFKAEELEGYTLDFFTQYYLENEPELVVENANLDTLFTMYVQGESK